MAPTAIYLTELIPKFKLNIMKLKRLLSLMMLGICSGGVVHAYEVGQDVTNLQTSWTGKSGNYQTKYTERYSKTAYQSGDILSMSITGLESVGYYEVQFYAVANVAWIDCATGPSIAQWYVNDVSDYMTIIGQTGCTPESETYLRKATVYVSDGNLKFGIKNVATGGNWYVTHLKSIVYKGNPSRNNPIDVTSTYVKNAGFETGDTQGWTTISSKDTGARSTTNDTYKTSGSQGAYLFNTWSQGTPCTQVASSMPAGKYELSATVASNGATIYLISGDNTADYAYAETTDQTIGVPVSKEFLLTADAQDYKIGVVGGAGGTAGEHKDYVADGYWWYKADDFQLKYYGNNIDVYAISKNINEEFSVEANTWYALPIAVASNYVFTVADDVTLSYTQDGTQPTTTTNVSTLASGEECALDAGVVYIKSSAATTIKMAAASYNYSLGNLTTSVADGGYTQTKTLAFTYPNAATNDATASVELSSAAKATVNGAEVALTAINNGFQLEMSDIAPSKDYTINVPAGIYGYTDKTMNDAITMTIHTPAVFDGTFFVKATDDTYAGKYISRGAAYNAEAALDPYGLAMKVATDSKNVSTFTLVDNNKFLSLIPSNILYTDGVTTNADYKYKYTIAKVDGGYTFYNIDQNKYLAAGVRDNNAVAMASDQAYAWTFETPENHTASMAALKDAQAKTVAAKAGLTATTVAELENAVNADLTSIDVAISLSGNEYYSDNGNQGNAAGTRSNTVTIANAGLYKFTLHAYTRSAGANDAYAMHTAQTEALVAYAFFGDNQTQVRSLYSEEGKTAATGGYLQPANASQWWPNNTGTGTTEFNSGKYANDIWMYLEPGDYTFGITNPSRALCASWTWFGSPKLTYYAANLYPAFAELYAKCKPWTAEGEYVTTYNSYAAYNNSTNAADLLSAINYLNANYDTYAWDNASMEHPYLVNGVIVGADNTANDAWPGNGRPITNGQHWSGDASRAYFIQNVRPNAARSQDVTIPKTGVYMLKTAVRTINGQGKAYAIISVGNQSTSTNYATGTTGGTIATDGTEYESVEAGVAAGATFANGGKGYGWVYNKVMFVTTAENTQTNISINLSHVSEDGEADCGGMYLYYVGQSADNIVGNTHYYYGAFANPTMEVTDDVPVVDATLATVNGATITRTNPNGLLYLANGSTADDGQNVIVDGTCANFVLADGHPFVAPKAFSATAATYTMTAIADGKFGTLMLPFAAQLPADGKAYSLDEDIDVVGGKVNGSEVTALTANTPVLVTKAGAYTGSNVDIPATTATSFTNGNLTGVYAQTEAPQGSYVLQNHPQSQGVAFYLVGNVKPTVKPFRAYIPAQSSNAKAIKVVFDGEATAIDGIAADEDANENVYDLSGRKVVKAHKGVYIKNGKKVIIK